MISLDQRMCVSDFIIPNCSAIFYLQGKSGKKIKYHIHIACYGKIVSIGVRKI